jgi:hypothetical protein
VIVHFCVLLPVTGSSIAYGRNVYPIPDPHKEQGISKSGKSFSGGKKAKKKRIWRQRTLKCPQKPQSIRFIQSVQFIELAS